MLFEKKTYPFHRVCGEYISNETLEFLKREELYPTEIDLPSINQFQLSSTSGKLISLPLLMGGFGISRYTFDHFLYKKALSVGVSFHFTEVEKIQFQNDRFFIATSKENFESDIVVGAFGKRSRVDIVTQRSFIKKRSPFIGVKYHLQIDYPSNLISLHNFSGGYCGISKIEDNKVNLCYLAHRDILKEQRSIQKMEEAVLHKNPHLKKIFSEAHHLFKSPETINEISFETKEPVWNHILNVGDAAGMITPLCGNGMAMAIHSAKLLSDILINQAANYNRESVERLYEQTWKQHFASRLKFGRFVQNKLFGTTWSSNIAVNIAVHTPFIAHQIVKKTHGKYF